MSQPGQYVPDPSEGITDVNALPQPQIFRRSRNWRRRRCPHCGHGAYRLRLVQRVLHDLGDPASGRPRDLQITYSQHRCSACGAYFNADMDDLALPKCHYTHRVVALAVRLVVEDGLPYRAASWHLWRDHRVFVPFATVQNWVEAGEKKAQAELAGPYLDEALAAFSGYIAADELYDGPFCVLSIVDNHSFRRLIYEVLDHDPQHEDIRRFFGRFQEALKARGRKVLGITTDASPLYPKPIGEVFGPVPHQICKFHVIAELTKAVLKAVTQARRGFKARLPKLERGRPRTAAQKRAARRKQRLQQKITDLFEHRHLFVQRRLSAAERRTLARLQRGQPRLRAVRAIMEEVYRLFDRRCRTETALEKLARLRRRVRTFKTLGKTMQKLFSPHLERALTFLNEALLPSTSNAVERGNRRHRKMQKTVYRVRTQAGIQGRIALDMHREAQSPGRGQTLGILHHARAGFS